MSLAGVVLLALGHGLAFMDRHVLTVAAPLVKGEMLLSDADLGLLLGPAFVVLYTAGLLLSRRLSLRPMRGAWLAACTGLWTFGMAVMALAPNFAVLLMGRALVGLGQAAFIPLALGLIVEGTREAVRARSVAVFTSGSVMGRCLGLIVGGAVLAGLAAWAPESWTPWRWLLLLGCFPNLILALTLMRADRSFPLPLTQAPPGLGPALVWMRRRFAVVGFYLIGTACGVLVIQTVGAWAPTLLHRQHGLSAGSAGMIFGLFLVVAAPVGHFTAGFLLDRPGRQIAPPEIGALSLAATIGLLWLLPSAEGAMSSLILLALISTLGAVAAVAALAGLPAMAPEGMKADAVRMCLVVTTLVGVGVGPWLAGLVSDLSGDLGQSLKWVGSAAAGLGVVASLLCIRGWRRLANEDGAAR